MLNSCSFAWGHASPHIPAFTVVVLVVFCMLSDGGKMKRKFLVVIVISLFLTGLLVPAPLSAQDAPSAPAQMALSEPPTTLVAASELFNEGVTSFSVPSPGLFWQLDAFCPFVPPGAAASASAPDATDGASDFFVKRKTVRNEETRTLMRTTDPTPGTGCNRYQIYSNIVADQSYVYWVDNTGLVRLPVTANVGDTPQLFKSDYATTNPVELVMTSDRVLVLGNTPGTGGPFGTLGNSFVEAVNKATGEITFIEFYLFNAGIRSLAYDGEYYYFLEFDNTLVRVDSAGTAVTVAENVDTFYPEGSQSFCLQLACTTTKYVFYSQDNLIRRYDNVDGATVLLQTRAVNVGTMVAARSSFFLNSLYFFETISIPTGPFTATRTHSLYRVGRTPNATPELLYSYNESDITPHSITRLTSNGEFLFWTEGALPRQSLKRLPNNVDALPKIDMAITGMEITQGVQNNANSVRLVRNRETYVRVFFRGDQTVNGATMRLYGTYNGIEHGPLLPLRATHLTAKTAPDRNQIDDAFLFALPWEWSQQPSITLRAELNPFKVPQEPNYANNSLSGQTFNFSEGRAIDVIFVEANYRIQRSLNDFSDYFVADTGVHAAWMRDAYPIPEGGLNYRVWTINGGALLGNHVMQVAKVCTDMAASVRSLCASDWVNAKIAQMRTNAGNGISAGTATYGLITDSSSTGGAFPRGQAGTDRVGSGPAGVSITLPAPGGTASYSDYGYYTGHEIGHMFGRAHPSPNSDDPATTMDSAGNPIVEGCGHSRSDNNYPYTNAFIGSGDGSIRGFDRSVPSSGGLGAQRVLKDTESYDMMSYCGNSQLRWPSDYTWEGLYQAIINSPATIAQTSLVGDFVGLYGVVYEDALFVHSVARMDNVTEQSPGNAGPLRLRLLGEGGNELATYLFAPEGDQAENEGQACGVVVPFVAGTRSLEIVDVASNQVRYQAPVSANAPTVSNVALDNPPNPVAGTVTLAWQAADADGDALTYDVFYSADSGTSFQPVALAVESLSAALDTSALAGGQGRFRVIANDGVNQGKADSPDYTMAVKAPQVRILNPADGEHFNWGQTVNFSGEALDPQDGLLTGTSFVWNNQKGELGRGSAQISVSDLPVGENVITHSAQNSAGLSASTQITIYVGDALEYPGPMLQVAPAALSFQFANGETVAKSSPLNLDNSGTGTLAWSATSDAGWLTLSAADGAVPGSVTVTASPTGLAANMLHQATITLTGTSAGNPDQVLLIPVEASIGNSFANPTGKTPEPNTPEEPEIPEEPETPGRVIFLPQISD